MGFPKSQQGWKSLLEGRFNRQEIMEFLNDDADARHHFRSIMLLQNAYAWRAAWLMKGAVHQEDNWDEFMTQAIEVLPTLQDGHQREILKLIELLPIKEDMEGPLFDICMSIWESPGKIPSVRMTAFLFILEVVKKYPDLRSEMDHLTQEHYMESLSPGVKRVLQKRIRALK